MPKMMNAVICLLTLSLSLYATVIHREGSVFFEEVEPNKDQLVRIVHPKGSPYEMGFQQGKLLKDLIEKNITAFIDQTHSALASRIDSVQKNPPQTLSCVPSRFLEEMRG